jgi:uncharacterized protein YggE
MKRFVPFIVIALGLLAMGGCGSSGGSGANPGAAGNDGSAAVVPGSGTSGRAGVGVAAAVGPAAAADQPIASQPAAGPPTTGQVVLINPAYTVTAQGVGEVTGTPDTLIAVIGVQTSAVSAKNALDDNNRKAAAVISTLKGKGVKTKDLQTTGLSLQPRYGTKDNEITGYEAFENVTATLRNLGSAGAIIDAAVSSAGNAARVQQLTFSIGDDTALRAQARADAVIKAHAQAATMAKAAGTSLGRVRSITEAPLDAQGGQQPYATAASSAGDAQSSAVPLEPGTQRLSVTVTVSYDLA